MDTGGVIGEESQEQCDYGRYIESSQKKFKNYSFYKKPCGRDRTRRLGGGEMSQATI